MPKQRGLKKVKFSRWKPSCKKLQLKQVPGMFRHRTRTVTTEKMEILKETKVSPPLSNAAKLLSIWDVDQVSGLLFHRNLVQCWTSNSRTHRCLWRTYPERLTIWKWYYNIDKNLSLERKKQKSSSSSMLPYWLGSQHHPATIQCNYSTFCLHIKPKCY